MNLDILESQHLCDWLLSRGVSLSEAAHILADLESGDAFALALMKMFKHRHQNTDKINEKHPSNRITPITP